MDMIDLLLAQLVEPFRIGLMIALVATTLRTGRELGHVVPAALGIVFVAVMLAIQGDGDRWTAIGVGLVANAILAGIAFALVFLWHRMVRPAA